MLRIFSNEGKNPQKKLISFQNPVLMDGMIKSEAEIKPILWILSILTLLTIIIDVHETFIANPRMAYPPSYDSQKFSIFLWKAVPAFFGSVILLLMLYKRERKLKQRHRDS